MASNLFVNEFMTIGVYDFFNSGNASSFESHIIECLCDVYGKDNIKNCYSEMDGNAFYSLIVKYCSPDLYDQLLYNCKQFEDYKDSNDNKYASYLEIIVAKMFIKKCIINGFTDEEVAHFENDLLKNFHIIQWYSTHSSNPNQTLEEWTRLKSALDDNVELIEVKPEYLDAYTYAKYGIDLAKVKQMDYRMVKELNSYIKSRMLEEEQKEIEGVKKKKLTLNTSISSGNGFVDALLIISIIATELSVGLIYLFLHL